MGSTDSTLLSIQPPLFFRRTRTYRLSLYFLASRFPPELSQMRLSDEARSSGISKGFFLKRKGT